MSKEFEYLVASRDPNFSQSVRAIELVKTFISENNLIIYGGSAIDYALRLRGGREYPDELLSIPDLDFFSPNSITDAYRLADVLYSAGYKSARAIVAQHIETMRVDAGDNHFIADITYIPPEIFPRIPTLVYNGMKIVHPDYQRIDLHSSLSFPFSNPPREVIFDRWKKDISRFNKLAELYPIEQPGVPARSDKSSHSDHKTIFTGFAAYAAIYAEFLRESKQLDYEVGGDGKIKIIPAEISITDGVVTFTSDGTVESVHMDMRRALEGVTEPVTHYDPYVNLLPPRAEFTRGRDKHMIYELRGQLVGVNSAEIGGKAIRFTGIQYTMKHFLSKYFVHRDQPRAAAVFLAYYLSLLEMIRVFERAAVAKSGGDELITRVCESVFAPSVRVYGSDNINLARSVALNRLRHDIYGDELIGLPANYYPERMKTHPSFDPASMEFFHEAGEKRD